jgi:N-acetylneuraminic acid mutarotase
MTDQRDTAVRRALPPGAAKRRAAFGLFDADGWPWAFWKALFWFLFIIFMSGYVPDRLYYFVVSPTIDLGYNVISPVNFCAASNKDLPCPATPGTVVPWEQSPEQAALPAPRSGGGTIVSGVNLYYVGGRGADGVATADVSSTVIMESNFAGGWVASPALPAPRTNAVVLSLTGTPYVIGGRDASGAPTTTVFRGTVKEGALTGWEEATDIALPVPLADAAGIATTRGIWIFGGRTTGDALTATVYRSTLGTGAGATLGAWAAAAEFPLPEPRADHSAVTSGNFVYVLGGNGPSGVTNSVYFLALTGTGEPRTDPISQRPLGWGVSTGTAGAYALPAARAKLTSFSNSGAIYAIGGTGPDGALVDTVYWATPDPVSGNLLNGWSHLDATDLPTPVAQAAAANVSSTAFLIGGDTPTGPTSSSMRANLAPARPFFRLGMFGVTVPALAIKGEIGQQLGYLAAGGAALGNFVVLVIIAIAYSHRRETRRFIQWITRGRFRVPPEDLEPSY